MGIFKLNNNLHSLADIRAQISDSMRVCVLCGGRGVFMSGIYVEKFQLFSDLFNYACIASAYTQQDSNNNNNYSNEEHYKLIFKCATLESCLSINS